VATLVAQGADSDDLFPAVVQEVAQVMHIPMVAVCRYADGGAAVRVIAALSDRPHPFHAGTLWPLDGPSVIARVLRTGRPARIEDYTDLPGALAAAARTGGHDRIAGAPIVVAGRIWGVMVIGSPDGPIPDGLEDRLAEFTELVATAISNNQAREDLSRIAEEQAALRRVATLVARGAPPAEVFEAVSVEVGALVPADGAALTRY
jgi:GAF domain-containing protein